MFMSHTILLYYKYVDISHPAALVSAQRALCEKLGLKGRILIAREGINGTVEGTTENAEAYVAEMAKDPRFADVHWKRSAGTSDGTAFPKLVVKVRKEIVSAHLEEFDPAVGDVNPTRITGTHLSPEELHSWFERGESFTIVDMRNDYEHASGHFKGSLLPPLKNFRDLPKSAEMLGKALKEKASKEKATKISSGSAAAARGPEKILTVCTGGVRCEKASGYLIKKGFENVYQLDGGIVSYMEKYPGQDFLGGLYVFDGRVVMHFDKPEKHVTIGRCGRCNKASEHYVNCKNLQCHYHFICCEACVDEAGEAHCADCAQKVAA